MAGAFAPAGACAGLSFRGWHRPSCGRPARAGKRGAFPCPARTGGRSDSWRPTPPQWQRPSPLPQCHGHTQPSRGPKPPASARPAPRRALRTRRAGRWPLVSRMAPAPVAASRTGGETRCVSLARPARRKVRLLAAAPPQWQRPSPLPQRHGHTQSSRGPKPPASARPATGGRFRTRRGLRWPLVSRVATVLRGAFHRGGGKRGAFPCPRPARRGARGGGFRAVAAGKAPQPQPAARGAAIRRSGRPAGKPVHQGLGSGDLAGQGFGPGDVPAAAQRRLGHHTRSRSVGDGAGNPTHPKSLPNP